MVHVLQHVELTQYSWPLNYGCGYIIWLICNILRILVTVHYMSSRSSVLPQVGHVDRSRWHQQWAKGLPQMRHCSCGKRRQYQSEYSDTIVHFIIIHSPCFDSHFEGTSQDWQGWGWHWSVCMIFLLFFFYHHFLFKHYASFNHDLSPTLWLHDYVLMNIHKLIHDLKGAWKMWGQQIRVVISGTCCFRTECQLRDRRLGLLSRCTGRRASLKWTLDSSPMLRRPSQGRPRTSWILMSLYHLLGSG